MASKFMERRSIRLQLKDYLEKHGWTNLNWAEGFSSFELDEIEVPFVAVILTDYGPEELEMGRVGTTNRLYTRRLQVYLYMESEDRLDALSDDIEEFMDLETVIIKDASNNILGNLISDTASIMVAEDAFALSSPDNIAWSAIVACMYEAYYPGE